MCGNVTLKTNTSWRQKRGEEGGSKIKRQKAVVY